MESCKRRRVSLRHQEEEEKEEEHEHGERQTEGLEDARTLLCFIEGEREEVLSEEVVARIDPLTKECCLVFAQGKNGDHGNGDHGNDNEEEGEEEEEKGEESLIWRCLREAERRREEEAMRMESISKKTDNDSVNEGQSNNNDSVANENSNKSDEFDEDKCGIGGTGDSSCETYSSEKKVSNRNQQNKEALNNSFNSSKDEASNMSLKSPLPVDNNINAPFRSPDSDFHCPSSLSSDVKVNSGQYKPNSSSMTSSAFSPMQSSNWMKPESWPGSAVNRHKIFLQSSFSTSTNYRVLYLPLVAYRVKSNLALDMAKWFSQVLKAPVDVLAFVEEEHCRDMIEFSREGSAYSQPFTAIRKTVARFSALTNFRSMLKNVENIDCSLCTHSAPHMMSQQIIDMYSQHRDSTSCQGDASASKSTPPELIVVLDDVFHPFVEHVTESLTASLSDPDTRIRVKLLVGFDNCGVVPFRKLLEEFRNLDRRSAMTTIAREFSAIIASAEKCSQAMSFKQVSVGTVNEKPVVRSVYSWNQVEESLQQVCQAVKNMQQLAGPVFLPEYCEMAASEALQSLIASKSDASYASLKGLESKLLDMYLSWNVISFLDLLSVPPAPGSRQWRKALIARLMNVEMCRHMCLYDYLHCQTQSQSPPQALCVNMLSLLSSSAVSQLHEVCSNRQQLSKLDSKEVILGKTPDEDFNLVQRTFRADGLLPHDTAAKLWFACLAWFIPLDLPSLLGVALREVVGNSAHLAEYSLWPLSFLIYIVEDVAASARRCREEGTTPEGVMKVLISRFREELHNWRV